ncbi:MAG TPA: hypothetical protein PLV42_11270 [bacterium]|nr:hypothetical protein [bacterium]
MMKRSSFESLLATVLTTEQIQALREEIVSGARRLHKIVDDNERARVRRDELLALMQRIDSFIEKKDSSPLFLRTMYSVAKDQVKKMIMPMIEEILSETESEGLDAVPPAKSVVKTAESRSEKPRSAEESGERRPEGASRRRRRPRRRSGPKKEGGAPSVADVETE